MGIRTKKAKSKDGWVVFTVIGDFSSKSPSILPSAKTRRAVAQNIEKIEDFIGTRFTRAKSGRIVSVIGGGAWGVVFRLENGSCLKISTDPVEGANAYFWMQSQQKKPILLNGSSKIYEVFKIQDRQKSTFSCVQREYVDIPRYFPVTVEAGLSIYQDNMIFLCASRTRKQTTKDAWLKAAKIGLKMAEKEAKGLTFALRYAWDNGMAQLDAGTSNIGIRTKFAPGVRRGVGNLVLFDYGGVSKNCWKKINKGYANKPLNIKNYVQKYDKKVVIL